LATPGRARQLEEIMQVKNRVTSIVIGSALAFGITLAASAASAQGYPVGRGANDGGQVGMSGTASAATPRQRRHSLAQRTGSAYPTGRGANDGGLVQVSAGGPVRATRFVAPQPSAPHYGRNADDGGPVD
jgi:hypothetical protein